MNGEKILFSLFKGYDIQVQKRYNYGSVLSMLTGEIGSMLLNRAISVVLLCGFGLSQAMAEEANWVQKKIKAFDESNIEFQRSQTYVPFVPLAFLGARSYGSSSIEIEGSDSVDYDLSSVTQAAGLPVLLNDNNALMFGEYLARTKFSPDGNDSVDSFHVDSFGLPIGWLQQVNSQWQAAAFVMPLAHKSSETNSDWTWQYLAGAFGRYVQSDQLWWAYGLYADVGFGDEDIYLPYLGASWSVNNHWTISAIMPWPAVLYSPNEDWLFQVGASPSGASWRTDDDFNDVSVNFDAWDFGFTAERRLVGNFWGSINSGVGGLRGLRFEGGDFEGAETSVSSSAYIGLSIKFRPAVR